MPRHMRKSFTNSKLILIVQLFVFFFALDSHTTFLYTKLTFHAAIFDCILIIRLFYGDFIIFSQTMYFF